MSTRPALEQATRQQLRDELTREREESHRLAAELARALRDAEKDDDTVYEHRFLIQGHADGPAAYIAVRRHGDAWAVIDNNSGHRPASWWDGRLWWGLGQGEPVNAVFRFTRRQAEESARRRAVEAAELHHRNALLEQTRRIEKVAAACPGGGVVPPIGEVAVTLAKLVADAEALRARAASLSGVPA
jgi:hypothetical protein